MKFPDIWRAAYPLARNLYPSHNSLFPRLENLLSQLLVCLINRE